MKDMENSSLDLMGDGFDLPDVDLDDGRDDELGALIGEPDISIPESQPGASDFGAARSRYEQLAGKGWGACTMDERKECFYNAMLLGANRDEMPSMPVPSIDFENGTPVFGYGPSPEASRQMGAGENTARPPRPVPDLSNLKGPDGLSADLQMC